METNDQSQESVLEQTEESQPDDTSSEAPPMVVGIGASAGGIRTLQSFFAALPERTGIVFVVVVHLSPEHESNLAQVLQAHTAMTAAQVRGRVRMEPDHVYVIPPNQDLKITDGHLMVSAFEAPRGRRAPIDVFFRTLAEVHPDGIGILLSGGGTDGTVGLKAIKEHGGLAMVQSPEEAEHEAMPQGGTLTLRGRQTDSQVQLDICDTGVGIPADRLTQIYEPLYTTKPGGTGFGLYLVRETVAVHGGEITVASEVGRGTTFTITLPLVTTEEATQHAPTC